MIPDTQFTIPPYSQVFNCMPAIIKSAPTFNVFFVLFGEHLKRKRYGDNTTIAWSDSSIGILAGVDRKHIQNYINNLCTMKIITASNAGIDVNADTVISLASAYHNLKQMTDKNNFVSALAKGDYVTLEKLGYEKISGQKLASMMSGSIIVEGENSEVGAFGTPVPKGTKNVPKAPIVPKGTGETGAFGTKIVPKGTTLAEEDYEIADFYASIITEIYTKNEFRNEFYDFFVPKGTTEEVDEFVESVFVPKAPTFYKLWPKFGHFLVLLTCTFWYNRPVPFGTTTCTFWYTLNKDNKKRINYHAIKKIEEKIKDIININKVVEVENETEPSSLNNKIIFDPVKPSSENNKNIEPAEDIPDSKEKFSELGISESDYSLIKKKKNLPYYLPEDVERYANDITACLDRPDKLYIHFLFQECHRNFDIDETVDEEGNVIVEANTNILHNCIPEDEMKKYYELPAVDALSDACRFGYVEDEKLGKLQIGFKAEDVDSRMLPLIMDWEKKVMSQGWSYVISYNNLRNIYAEEVPAEINRLSSTPESNQADVDFMEKIIKLGDTDEGWEKLTPMEKAVCWFLNEFFVIKDDGELVEPKEYVIHVDKFTQFCASKLVDLGISGEELLKASTKVRRNEFGHYMLHFVMFSSQMIKRWNSLHSYQSVVDDVELTLRPQP